MTLNNILPSVHTKTLVIVSCAVAHNDISQFQVIICESIYSGPTWDISLYLQLTLHVDNDYIEGMYSVTFLERYLRVPETLV